MSKNEVFRQKVTKNRNFAKKNKVSVAIELKYSYVLIFHRFWSFIHNLYWKQDLVKHAYYQGRREITKKSLFLRNNLPQKCKILINFEDMRKNRVTWKTLDTKKYKTERNKKIGHFRPRKSSQSEFRPKNTFFDQFFSEIFAKNAIFCEILNLCKKIELSVKLGCWNIPNLIGITKLTISLPHSHLNFFQLQIWGFYSKMCIIVKLG